MNSPRRALIVVDVQYDFLPLGSLAVPNSDEVLKPIYKLLESHSTWSLIIASQDYHPHNHISFASRYPGESPFTKIKINNSAEEQDLWPTHCVQETKGSEIEEGIMERLLSNKAKIVRKVRRKELNKILKLLIINYLLFLSPFLIYFILSSFKILGYRN